MGASWQELSRRSDVTILSRTKATFNSLRVNPLSLHRMRLLPYSDWRKDTILSHSVIDKVTTLEITKRQTESLLHVSVIYTEISFGQTNESDTYLELQQCLASCPTAALGRRRTLQ